MYNHGRYYSRSNTFYNRNNYYRGGGEGGVARNVQRGVSGNRGGAPARANAGNRPSNGNIGGRGEVNNRSSATARAFNGNTKAARGYAEPRGQSGTRTGAFSGYGKGGQAKSYSSRGSASMGGGGAHGGGGGAAHGGGGGHH